MELDGEYTSCGPRVRNEGVPISGGAPAGTTAPEPDPIYTLFADGASRGNPGPAAIGVVLLRPDGEVVFKFSGYIGQATNNVAEYRALLRGLKEASGMGIRRIQINLDSELIVRQLNGDYRVRHEGLKPFYTKVIKLLQDFDFVEIKHVNRKENKMADKLANEALNEALY